MLIGSVSAYSAATAPRLPALSPADRSTAQGPEAQAKPAGAEPAPPEPSGKTDQEQNNPRQESIELLEIARLRQRDQEVRAHEQAHAAVGGRYAGAPSYTYTSGPDGKRYAIGGEVSIDSSAIANDPQATISKMEWVIRAALAPAEPSAQDLRVAAQAQVTLSQARADLVQQRREESRAGSEEKPAQAQKQRSAETEQAPRDVQQERSTSQGLDLYRQVSDVLPASAGISLLA